LDLEFRRALVVEKGGDRAYVHWETPTARLLPRLLQGRTTGPVFLVDRRAPVAGRRAAGPADIDPATTTRTAPGTPCTSCATRAGRRGGRTPRGAAGQGRAGRRRPHPPARRHPAQRHRRGLSSKGFEALTGARHADLRPGSTDLPLVTDASRALAHTRR